MVYLIVIALVAIIWLVFIDRPVLKVRFRDGKIVMSKGHFPATFQHNLQAIGHKNAFSGELKVYSLRTGMKLVFSKQIPVKIQQRIRNVFPHQGIRGVKGKHRA